LCITASWVKCHTRVKTRAWERLTQSCELYPWGRAGPALKNWPGVHTKKSTKTNTDIRILFILYILFIIDNFYFYINFLILLYLFLYFLFIIIFLTFLFLFLYFAYRNIFSIFIVCNYFSLKPLASNNIDYYYQYLSSLHHLS
jgi:hypothetical protein